MPEKEYYSPQEIAAKFNIKPRTVSAWIRQGKLKAIKLGDLWRVHITDLNDFIQKSQSNTNDIDK